MLHSIHELAEDIRRQVKRHRDKRRARAETRRAIGRLRRRAGVSRASRDGTLDTSMAGRGTHRQGPAPWRGQKFKEYGNRVDSINRFEPEIELLDDAEIRREPTSFADAPARTESRSTTCSRRRSRWSARPASAPSASATSTSS